MTSEQEALSRLHRHMTRLLVVRRLVLLAAGWFVVWGVVLLALRVGWALPRTWLLWGFAGLVPMAMLATWLGRRETPSVSAVRAMLDRHNRCGGLLMAGQITPLGPWQDRVANLTQPGVRWRSGRAMMLLALAAAFVAGGFTLPDRVAQMGRYGMDVSQPVEELTQQIEVLKEEKILRPEMAKILEEKVSQAQKEASGQEPARTWEALDHVRAALEQTADRAAEQGLAKTQQLAQSQALAEALAKGALELDQQTLAQAMKDLAGMVAEAMSQNADLAGELPPGLAEQLAKAAASLTPEQLQAIAEACGECKGDLREQLARLEAVKLISARTLGQCEQAGECDSEALLVYLKENPGESACKGAGQCMSCNRPGRGGVNRGRGDAPMVFGQGTPEDDAKFQSQVLPPPSLEALKQSMRSGVSTGAPQIEKDAGPSTGGALSNTAAGGGSAHRQNVLPRHQPAVKKYFDRQTQDQ